MESDTDEKRASLLSIFSKVITLYKKYIRKNINEIHNFLLRFIFNLALITNSLKLVLVYNSNNKVIARRH